jgi:uncharacterized membrane protein
MTRIEHSVIIHAPVEKVFSYVADYQTWADWFEGVSDFKATTTVTQGNGARYAYKARLFGVSVGVETEIHDFVQNRGWTGVATKGMPHRTYWVFETVENSTKFSYALEYKLPIPLLGSLLDTLFMKSQWHTIIEKSLTKLNQHFITQDVVQPQ